MICNSVSADEIRYQSHNVLKRNLLQPAPFLGIMTGHMPTDYNAIRLSALEGLPLPPNMAELLGYLGDARFVAVTEQGGDITLTDGRVGMGGEKIVWQAYVGHPKVLAILEPQGFAAPVPPAGRALMLDRRLTTAHLGPVDIVTRFLKNQWSKKGAQRDDAYSTAEFERTLDGLKKAVDLMEDTSLEQMLDRNQLRRRRLEAMQRWLTGLN